MSLGIENSAEDVDTLIDVLGKIARQPRAMPRRMSSSRWTISPGLRPRASILSAHERDCRHRVPTAVNNFVVLANLGFYDNVPINDIRPGANQISGVVHR